MSVIREWSMLNSESRAIDHWQKHQIQYY